ncbi:g9934 [Coccomyxa elongata]
MATEGWRCVAAASRAARSHGRPETSGQCGGLALNHLPSGPWQGFLHEGHPMACAQGFCVPAETPGFSALCATMDSSSSSSIDSSVQAAAPSASSGDRSGIPQASAASRWLGRSPAQDNKISTSSSSRATGGNATTLQPAGVEGNTAGDLRAVAGDSKVDGTSFLAAQVSSSNHVPTTANRGVPGEITMLAQHSRRLAQNAAGATIPSSEPKRPPPPPATKPPPPPAPRGSPPPPTQKSPNMLERVLPPPPPLAPKLQLTPEPTKTPTPTLAPTKTPVPTPTPTKEPPKPPPSPSATPTPVPTKSPKGDLTPVPTKLPPPPPQKSPPPPPTRPAPPPPRSSPPARLAASRP